MASSCDEQAWRKGPWTPQEDKLLIEYVSQNGEGRWSSVSEHTGTFEKERKELQAEVGELLEARPQKGHLTPQEEGIIIELHALWGNKWSTIARYLPGRTDNEIKNYWRTHFKTRKPCGVKKEERKFIGQKQQPPPDHSKDVIVSDDDDKADILPIVNQEAASADCYNLWGGLWDLDVQNYDHMDHANYSYSSFLGDAVDYLQSGGFIF